MFCAHGYLRCCPIQNGAFAAVWKERGLQGDKVRFHVKQNKGREREKVIEKERERESEWEGKIEREKTKKERTRKRDRRI